MLRQSIVFVLGSPGSGKGSICQKIVENFGLVHLSAGELLIQDHQDLVLEHSKSGTCVPSSITVSAIESAMNQSPNNVFLIDGFPRNEENLETWNILMGDKVNIKFVLFLDCDMETCIQRCLGRGRKGDTLEILKARFAGHYRDSLPIVEHYQKLGLVRKVDTNRPVSEIFEEIKTLFSAL